nr:methyl-accepting chemotaxis protein [uncultured Catonella sp.]
MKKEKKKVGSVGKKVGIIISIILLVILGSRAVYDSITSYNLAVKSHEDFEREETEVLAKHIEGRFKKAYEAGAALIAATKAVMSSNSAAERNRQTINEIVKEIFLTNPDLSGLGIFFEPNGFDGKDISFVRDDNKTGAMGIYVSGEKGNINIKTTDYYFGNTWYTMPIEAGKDILVEPYISSVGKLVVTYAMPVIFEGKPVGAINVDIDIDGISDELAVSSTNNDEDFSVLLSNEGVIVAHSMDKSRVMRNVTESNPKIKEYLAAAGRNEETLVTEKSQRTGKESRMIYVPVNIEGTDTYWAMQSINTVSYFVKDAVNGVILNVVLSIITIIVIALVIFSVLNRMVSRPLSILASAIKKFSEYDLDVSKEGEMAQKLGYLDANDRVGVTMRAMSILNDNLVGIMKEISNYAQNTAATAEELTATAKSTADMAVEVANAVGNIAEHAACQAEDTKSAAESSEVSGGYIMEMIETVKELADATEIIDKCKDDGNATLKELVRITEDNKEISGKVSRVIDETSKAAEKISNASEMIQSISDQTNLLALNAAIEAARAGEAGKGFAVVADEIRKLAEQSAGFTAEIRTVIDELKVKAESAVNMMEDSSRMVISQSEKVDETGEKFDEISKAVENSKSIVITISKASKTMEVENRNVINIIKDISTVAEENAASTEEAASSVESQTQTIEDISRASESLAQIAADLQNEVSKFKF